MGHRGAAARSPENTLSSFQRALADGADMVEMDLQLTADGRLVAVHDWTLERLAGSPRAIEAHTFSELRAVAWPRGLAGGFTPLPALEEILASLPPEYPLNLELKLAQAPRARFATALVEVIADRPNVLISSFDEELLLGIRALDSTLPLAPLADRDPEALLKRAARLRAWAVHVHHRLATQELVAAARAGGWPVLAFTVNRPRRASDLLRAGVAGLFTDDPGALRRGLATPLSLTP